MTRKLLAIAMFVAACAGMLYISADADAIASDPNDSAVEEGAAPPVGEGNKDEKKPEKGEGKGKFGGKFDPEKFKDFKGKFGKGGFGKDGKFGKGGKGGFGKKKDEEKKKDE